ncbi:MAG: hypothetical protein ACQESG_04930 [Nanobdellota archaeon]
MRYLLLLLLVCHLGLAQITLEKRVESPVEVGDKITVSYEIENEFDTELVVTLTDENVIGDEGFVIECLQFKLPPQSGGELDLEKNKLETGFIAPKSGTFELGNATLTFKNPDLGIVESVSDTAGVKITGTGSVTGNVTRINTCSEQEQQKQQQQQQEQQNQMSKEEAQKRQEEQEKKNQEQQKEMQKQYERQSDMDKKLEHAQQSSNQNTKATKEALEKGMQRRQQQEQALEQALQNNSRLQNRLEDLQQKGYKTQNRTVTPRGNKTGDFEFGMNNGSHSTNLRGTMNNGTLEELVDPQRMQEQLSQNPHYQDLKKGLDTEGFKPHSFNPTGEQSFRQQFQDRHGNTKTITHAEGNLSTSNDFSIDSNFRDEYLLKELANDTKYQRLSGELLHQGYSQSGIHQGETAFVEFKKDNQTRRVYFSVPEEEGFLDKLMHTFAVGFDYLFARG